MTADRNRRLLVIDDTRDIHGDFHKILGRQSTSELEVMEAALFGDPAAAAPSADVYTIDSAYQGREGFEMVRDAAAAGTPYALAFVDMRMPPGWNGMETVKRIFEVDDEIQIVICTAYSDYSWEEIIESFAGTDRLLILKKPFDTVEVCQLACALTEKWHLAKHAHLKLNQLRAVVEEKSRELHLANHALAQEVAGRARSEEALHASETRYRLASSVARDALWDWDPAEDRMHFSPRWREILGYPAQDGPLRRDEWLASVHPDDVERVRGHLEEHLAGDADQLNLEYRAIHASDQHRWILCRGMAFRDPAGRIRRVAGSQTDITDRRMAEEQLRVAALHDGLTGLPNRALLTERLARWIPRRGLEGPHVAVLLVDLDRFEVVNEGLGRDTGDQLLLAVSRRLVSCLRALDLAPVVSSVVRLGGDELVVLLEGLDVPARAEEVARRILEAIDEPFAIGDRALHVAASVGIAVSHTGYRRADDMLRDADIALDQAKASGKERVQRFDPTMHVAAVSRRTMEQELRRAIDGGGLTLAYQPIVSLTTGSVSAIEALVRWRHPERGPIEPAELVRLAEATGLVVALGEWVLDRACAQMKRWRELPGMEDVAISVNVAREQLVRTDFGAAVVAVLDRHELDPRCLQLEITESALMDGRARVAEGLATLRAAGIRVSLDDFGTGYSSLSYLQRIPIDSIKIDRSFIAAMEADQTSAAIVRAIVALAGALGTRVIAEGVESESQRAQLETMGCDLAQGWHFHRASDPDEIPPVVAGRAARRGAVERTTA